MQLDRRSFLSKVSKIGLGAAAFPVQLQGMSAPSLRSSSQSTLARAKENIEQIRKRDMQITFLDKWGQPLSGFPVQLKQLQHEFLFGDQNWGMGNMFRQGQSGALRLKYYRDRFKSIFNSLNTTVYWTERPRTNGTKTMDFQGDLQLDDFEESVNWANANGLTAKGHPLFWSLPKAIPEWAKKYDPDTFMKFVEVRVRNLTARYNGKVKIWDAVNEALWEPAPKNLSQRTWPYTETMENLESYISKVIRWGREESPGAKFVINDYGIGMVNKSGLKDQYGTEVTTKRQRQRYIELVKRLGESGFSPNALGLQSHTGWLTPDQQYEFYDEMATAGLPLTITEFWAHTKSLMPKENASSVESEEWRTLKETDAKTALTLAEAETLRDQYVLDYLTVAFGHPAVQSFYFWGFMGMATSFSPSPSSAHTLKPLYEKVRKRLHEEWNTAIQTTTNSKGE
ncbi:MAG: endo-1,4-beta-xylanase, partial [Mameliella sp.]|nr:endo-1,4-beta-xylanase [Phaeodactylibacter sp.]